MIWQMLMNVDFSFIPVTFMLSVRTLLEAMNASARMVTVAMERYAMVITSPAAIYFFAVMR